MQDQDSVYKRIIGDWDWYQNMTTFNFQARVKMTAIPYGNGFSRLNTMTVFGLPPDSSNYKNRKSNWPAQVPVAASPAPCGNS